MPRYVDVPLAESNATLHSASLPPLSQGKRHLLGHDPSTLPLCHTLLAQTPFIFWDALAAHPASHPSPTPSAW